MVTNLNDYENELVIADLTLTGDMAPAGGGHVSASADTDVLIGDNLKLRVTDAVQAVVGLSTDCTLTVGPTPLWRYNTQVQVHAWVEADLAAISCPAPQVVEASANAADTVVVTFDQGLDVASVLTDGSQFTADNGLTISAAAADGATVTLTTSTQTGGTTYTITVADTVTNIGGAGVDSSANTASFDGFAAVVFDHLIITEVYFDHTSSDDGYEWVKIHNPTSAAINLNEYSLGITANNADLSSVTVQLAGSLDAGGCYLVGGPTADGSNGVSIASDYNIPVQITIPNGGPNADAVALFNEVNTAVDSTTVPIDVVIFAESGGNNDDGIMDETGAAGAIEAPDVAPTHSIRMLADGSWEDAATPTPLQCPPF